MAPLWQRLKDAYIPSVFNAITLANPSAAAEALWMTASQHVPFKPQFDPSTHQTPRWDDIPFINFSTQGGNTISPNNVSRAIEALSATFGRRPATRHLVIIAAVNPPAGAPGHRQNLAWTTAVERLHQGEIRAHLIVRSQSEMDGLTPLYWDLIGKGCAYQSFADDTQFAFYLCDFHDTIDKGKASATDNRRVPNSGSQSTSTSSIDKPSLVYQLQKMNGMEKKRRSRTRRDQPPSNKPGQPYQKNNPQTRASSSTIQPASPDPSNRSPSRRKDTPRVSNVEEAPSYFDLTPHTASPEHRSPYSSAASPSRSSSPSSPYYLSAETSSSSGSRNISPLRASLPIPTPTFDHFQHMALASHSTPDSLSPTSPGYHELQGYNQELTAELRTQHHVPQTIPADGLHLATQFDDIYGSGRSRWNTYDRQQGRTELSAYPRSLASHLPDALAPRLAHRPEQAATTSSLPPMSHTLDTPPAGNPSGSYFYPDYDNRAAGTSIQNTYLFNRSPDAGSSANAPYYS